MLSVSTCTSLPDYESHTKNDHLETDQMLLNENNVKEVEYVNTF
jgi:hypothetical protein